MPLTDEDRKAIYDAANAPYALYFDERDWINRAVQMAYDRACDDCARETEGFTLGGDDEHTTAADICRDLKHP